MPKPVDEMKIAELRREIERIEKREGVLAHRPKNDCNCKMCLSQRRLTQLQEELEKRVQGADALNPNERNANPCETCGQENWKEGSWKREFDDKYAELMNCGDVDWIDKANGVLGKALDQISVLVKQYEKVH
jgi:hypothetical protein